jgi:hypothetical protein
MGFLAQLTPKRRTALVSALVLWLVSLAWFVQGIVRTPPAQWSVALAIVMTTLGSLSCAAVVVEMFRPFFHATAVWTDRTHFRCVALLFAVFAVIQNSGILVAMSAHGVHAF